MHFDKSTRGAAALLALGLTLAAAATAQAAPQWYNGVSVQSTIYNPCLGITEVGAAAQAGYRIDPATTRAGDVFYGHALFGAATHVGGNCTNTEAGQAHARERDPPAPAQGQGEPARAALEGRARASAPRGQADRRRQADQAEGDAAGLGRGQGLAADARTMPGRRTYAQA